MLEFSYFYFSFLSSFSILFVCASGFVYFSIHFLLDFHIQFQWFSFVTKTNTISLKMPISRKYKNNRNKSFKQLWSQQRSSGSKMFLFSHCAEFCWFWLMWSGFKVSHKQSKLVRCTLNYVLHSLIFLWYVQWWCDKISLNALMRPNCINMCNVHCMQFKLSH